ncbi:MAG: TIGR02206 family membrane protein [Alphaproteobacteria bacterium]|nr:TIGR02206 family membrane protein [Alphaproteobacteria bacterium]MDE2014564.1 TIGR02206 family membrane protein [Alphaproteobacteria bacterium]MDE2072355.1 TIGR02206 family membrane protein [Alphaproteobacteria bacterium]MDE2351563.1 TIGR02206 family membrane protein [Alphaproteobacteria bacterium]
MFVPLGTSHLVALALVMTAAAGFIAAVRRRNVPRLVRAVRAALAALLAGSWMAWVIFVYAQGWSSVGTLLPMNLCDWATIVVEITLLFPNQRSYELGYFWVLGGTLQALVTPALALDFPSPAFVIFFALHGGVMVSILFLTIGVEMRPWPSSIPRVAFWSLVYLATTLTINARFGTNFGFLSAKPPEPSLLDYLSPWPIYIVEEILLGGAIIVLLYAPYLIHDRIAARRARL